MEILPGVLAHDEIDFRKRLFHKSLRAVASMFHIDVLDGTLVNAHCWGDPKIIAHWENIPQMELHCMVTNPVAVAEAWISAIPQVKRIILHQEIGPRLPQMIEQLRKNNLEIIIAVNPKTPVDHAGELNIDGLMIMGVEPGQSGQPFLGEPILAKIRRAHSLYPSLPIAIDGGVSETTVGAIAAAGATRCVAASALWKAENPATALHKLENRIH